MRSLHQHTDLVRHDQILSASHINLFCETRVSHTDCVDMYNIDNFNVIMHPSHSSNNRRPHYGLALYSKLPTLQSCQPVSLASSYGTVECALLQVAVEPSILLTVVCVYRCPSSDFSHFTTAMSQLLAGIKTQQTHMTHHTVIMDDFNLDWLDHSVPPRHDSSVAWLQTTSQRNNNRLCFST